MVLDPQLLLQTYAVPVCTTTTGRRRKNGRQNDGGQLVRHAASKTYRDLPEPLCPCSSSTLDVSVLSHWGTRVSKLATLRSPLGVSLLGEDSGGTYIAISAATSAEELRSVALARKRSTPTSTRCT